STPSSSRFEVASAWNKLCALPNIRSEDVTHDQKYLASSPNLSFFSPDKKSEIAVIPSPVPKSEKGKNPGGKGEGETLNPKSYEHSAYMNDIYLLVKLETVGFRITQINKDCKKSYVKNLNFSLKVKMPSQMNVTSGSLEDFGGDVSKGDMETSDLITCVAELQYTNQKLQEENAKLKLTLEAGDETTDKLLADNEALHQQIRSIQYSMLKAKSLEEELDDAKTSLSISEEKRQKILCQNKQLEKENRSLIIQLTSLQEEAIRNRMDTDELEKKISELSKNADELQIQADVYEGTLVSKEASLIQKEQVIKELKITIVEYSSVIETLRAEKKKLLENVQHLQQELISNGLSLPLLCKFNSNIPEGMNSLQCELELAQSSEITEADWLPLDETLDREVLILLHGPEYVGEKFKTVMQNLVSARAYVN
ncbi:LRMP protein, partial [Turnix velox]|nr:LRMP protein [Turnix velox]